MERSKVVANTLPPLHAERERDTFWLSSACGSQFGEA